jgi:hypothetical protein
LRSIGRLHSIDEYEAAQERPPLTPAKQAVEDQNAARDAAAARRHAAAGAERAAREEAAHQAGLAHRAAVIAKRKKVGRA